MESNETVCPRCGATNPAGARYCGRCGIPQANSGDALAVFSMAGRTDDAASTPIARLYETPPAAGISAAMDEFRPVESARLAAVGFVKGVVSVVLLWLSAFCCSLAAFHGYEVGTPVGRASAVIAALLWFVIPVGSSLWMWRQAGRGYLVGGFFALAIALLIYI